MRLKHCCAVVSSGIPAGYLLLPDLHSALAEPRSYCRGVSTDLPLWGCPLALAELPLRHVVAPFWLTQKVQYAIQ